MEVKMEVNMKVDILVGFKYCLLKEAQVLVKEQSNLILSKDYKNLAECLEKTEKIIEDLKDVDIKMEQVQAEIKTYTEDENCSNILCNFNLYSEIKDLADDVYQSSLNCQENAKSMLIEVEKNIMDNNLNRKCFESYFRANNFENSLYFDQNR